MLTISTVNQVEGKNIIQILLVQYCKYGTFMFFSGFIIEIFNHLCCSLDTRNTRNLFLSRTKLLCKIRNFKEELLEGLSISVQSLQKWEGSLLS